MNPVKELEGALEWAEDNKHLTELSDPADPYHAGQVCRALLDLVAELRSRPTREEFDNLRFENEALMDELASDKASLAASEAERERLRGALADIAAQENMTLLGPQWDIEHHHEEGANKAFGQMARLAKAALAPAAGPEEEK